MATAPPATAASAVAGQVVGDLNDPEYLNWYKTNRVLNLTIEVLRPVCLVEMHSFHSSLVQNHTSASCGKPCTHSDIHRKCGKWSIYCPSKVCSKWLPDLVRERMTTSTKLTWQNSDFSQWQTQPWQLAKVYMDHGQDIACVNPTDTDAAGIVQLLLNCKRFQSVLDPKKVDAIRLVRNKLMHTNNMKVTTTDLTTYVQTMVDLLEDPVTLLQDPAAIQSVAEIKLIETTPVEVNHNLFLVNERKVWKTHIAGLSDDNKKEIRKLVSSNSNLENRLQGVEKDVALLKNEMKQVKDAEGRLNEMTNEVKQEVKDVEERLNKTTGEVKQEVKDVEERLNKTTGEVKQQVNDVAEHLNEETDTVKQQMKYLQGDVGELGDRVGRLEAARGPVKTENIGDDVGALGDRVGTLEAARGPTTTEDIGERLKKALQERYKDIELDDDDKSAPLDEAHVELRLQRYDIEVLTETLDCRDVAAIEACMQSSPVVLLPKLFDKLEDKIAPKKLLLRGKAGVGKSTLVRHIANQWAVGKLWKDVFSHIFMVTLKELLEGKWTIHEFLLGGLRLSRDDFDACLDYISLHANTCLILVDGLDEIRDFEYHKSPRVPDRNAPMELSLLLSGIVGDTMLPGANILVTSRPSRQLPMEALKHIVELYGFTRDSIHRYVSIFCGNNKGLKQFITKSLEESVNLITFCYIPILCKFVCRVLTDAHTNRSNGDVQIATMTHLYVAATTNSAKKLHPHLKSKTDMDLDEVLEVVGEPYRKYANLATRCVMIEPLRIIFYKDDLIQVGLDEGNADDMQCGVMTQSRKREGIRGLILHNRCWLFNHLTLQEYFSALGLLQGKADDIMALLVDKSSIQKHEVVISFIMGLSGDKDLARYRSKLLSRQATLDLRTLVKTLADRLKDDPLKLVTLLHETQDADVVDVVPREIITCFMTIYPTEMRALSWVLQQDKCPVTTLNLSNCGVDSRHVTDLSVGLAKNTSIQILNFHRNSGMFEEEDAGKSLGSALAAMPELCQLDLAYCALTGVAFSHIAAGLSRGCQQLKEMSLSGNPGMLEEAAGQSFEEALASMTQLRKLELDRCDFTDAAFSHIAAGLDRGCRQLMELSLYGNPGMLTEEDAGRCLGSALASMPQLRKLNLGECDLIDVAFSHIAAGLGRRCQQLKELRCQGNFLTDDSKKTFKTLLMCLRQLRIWAGSGDNVNGRR